MNRAMILSAVILLATTTCWSNEPNEGSGEQSTAVTETDKPKMLGIVLYKQFELLDAAGPIEAFSYVPGLKLVTVAEQKGPVRSTQKVDMVAEYDFNDCPPLDLILVPGGIGCLREFSNETMLTWLKSRAPEAQITMSVCSGSGILAKAGLLDGKKATTNKMSYKLLIGSGPNVEWVHEARWVDEGDVVTSSGVSAGIDMALGVIERVWGEEQAEAIANGMEFDRHRDPTWDPFAKLYAK